MLKIKWCYISLLHIDLVSSVTPFHWTKSSGRLSSARCCHWGCAWYTWLNSGQYNTNGNLGSALKSKADLPNIKLVIIKNRMEMHLSFVYNYNYKVSVLWLTDCCWCGGCDTPHWPLIQLTTEISLKEGKAICKSIGDKPQISGLRDFYIIFSIYFLRFILIYQ